MDVFWTGQYSIRVAAWRTVRRELNQAAAVWLDTSREWFIGKQLDMFSIFSESCGASWIDQRCTTAADSDERTPGAKSCGKFRWKSRKILTQCFLFSQLVWFYNVRQLNCECRMQWLKSVDEETPWVKTVLQFFLKSQGLRKHDQICMWKSLCAHGQGTAGDDHPCRSGSEQDGKGTSSSNQNRFMCSAWTICEIICKSFTQIFNSHVHFFSFFCCLLKKRL